MQTFLAHEFLRTEQGGEADRILRTCVHCGFCNATCPTFLLTGNELDSPRGRIYLIKAALEGGKVTRTTQSHLDRCLSCQSCETTCPSGVRYHDLLGIGRGFVEQKVGRMVQTAAYRFLMRKLFTQKWLFATALTLGQLIRPVLPAVLRKKIPLKRNAGFWPQIRSRRKMIVLNGCVQNCLSPATNAAAARILARLGIQALSMPGEVCCGALSYHLNAQAEGFAQARHNIDRLCEQLDLGVEAIISTASGCGNFYKGYAGLFAGDAEYADKAARVAARVKDVSEILQGEGLTTLRTRPGAGLKLAFHCPCSLQHGQGLAGAAESILTGFGVTLTRVVDAHLCCGSAGTYSILQPDMARRLRASKIAALEMYQPDAIATANVGCEQYLGAVAAREVKHWIEYLDELLE